MTNGRDDDFVGEVPESLRKDLVELPPGLEKVEGVPTELKAELETGIRPCGDGRYAWEWAMGEAKGLPISVYCAEPLCLQTGSCTGPRFVPHMIQVDQRGEPRKITANEAVMASKVGAQQARQQTGRPDTRSDTAIGRHIAEVWKKAQEAVKGGSFRQ